MAKHNRDATVLSMILGFTTLALFVDGLLRMLGIIPPFMHIDVNILDKIETDIIDKIRQVPIQKIFQQNFRWIDFTVFIYFLCFAAVAGATFAYMYAMMTSTLRDFNRQQERRNVHPEMSDVQSGEDF